MKKLFEFVLCTAAALMLAGCANENPSQQQTAAQTEITAETVLTEQVTETTTVTEPEPVDPVTEMIGSMTLEQKAGQILLARFTGDNASEMADKYQPGGFTLYADDFKLYSPDAMEKRISQIKGHFKIPAFMAVDEEGGTVVRISKFPQYRLSPFSSQIALARGGEELVKTETEEKAKLLASLGINLNLAPVADVTDDHADYIYERTFGEDVELTGDYIAMTVEIMNGHNMGSCLKHFPGYGSNADTHNGMAVDSREESVFEEHDFIPFKKGIEAGVPAVMVNHNIVEAYDSEYPASLSEAVHEKLRELGFEGVIITDDMGMEAITQFELEESPYVKAVHAGNDLLCVTDLETAYNDILAALNDGTIEESRIDESIRRILEMKIKLGMISVEN